MSDESILQFSPADEDFSKLVLGYLLKYYPGHNWLVQTCLKAGWCTIRNPAVSYKMGMRMILPEYLGPRDLELKVMRFAGEFLERYDIRRQKADRDEQQARYLDARFR